VFHTPLLETGSALNEPVEALQKNRHLVAHSVGMSGSKMAHCASVRAEGEARLNICSLSLSEMTPDPGIHLSNWKKAWSWERYRSNW